VLQDLEKGKNKNVSGAEYGSVAFGQKNRREQREEVFDKGRPDALSRLSNP
jgi:hypothetical protein